MVSQFIVRCYQFRKFGISLGQERVKTKEGKYKQKKNFNSEVILFYLAREPDVGSQSDYEYEDDFMEPEPPQKRTVPTVFVWENGGREVLLSGSFNDWKTRIPMNLRLVINKLFKITL